MTTRSSGSSTTSGQGTSQSTTRSGRAVARAELQEHARADGELPDPHEDVEAPADADRGRESRHLARPASMFPRYSADDWSPSLGCADLEHLAAIVEAETRRAAARDAPAAHRGSDPLSGLGRAFEFCGSQERVPCIQEIAVILADVHHGQQVDDVARRADGDLRDSRCPRVETCVRGGAGIMARTCLAACVPIAVALGGEPIIRGRDSFGCGQQRRRQTAGHASLVHSATTSRSAKCGPGPSSRPATAASSP